MVWPLGILLLLAIGWLLLTRRRMVPSAPALAAQPEPLDGFAAELARAVATYEKDQLACTLRRIVIIEGHPDALMKLLEAKYGRCEGSPFLDLQSKWNARMREGIRLWMTQNELPFIESAPPIQQLEQALEARIETKARAILEAEAMGKY